MIHKISKHYRIHPNDLKTIKEIAKMQGITQTRVIEKSIMFYADKLGIQT